MAETSSVNPRLEKLAGLRDDFMRRWFGVAISVGFAATVVQMGWVHGGRPPSYSESEQLARLLAAGAATVLSWEGYLMSISTKKLYEFRRYLVDILLVFVYLFLLLTSRFSYYWLALHAITFGLYIVWDCLTARSHPEWYRAAPGTPLLKMYWRGLIGNDVDRGLAITLIWSLYFVWLWRISQARFALDTFILAAFVLLGLAGYRSNKSDRYRNDLRYSYGAPLAAGLSALIVALTIQRVTNGV
jgi:hypothetical protein